MLPEHPQQVGCRTRRNTVGLTAVDGHRWQSDSITGLLRWKEGLIASVSSAGIVALKFFIDPSAKSK
jgi:hypothetical protein